MGIEGCLYVSVKKRGLGNTLGWERRVNRAGEDRARVHWTERRTADQHPLYLLARQLSKRKRVSPPYPLVTDLSACDDDVQRCDAKRPCTPCSKDGGSDCVYEQSQIKKGTCKKSPTIARALPFSSKIERTLYRLPSLRVNGASLSAPDIAPSDAGSYMLSNLSNVPTTSSHLSDFDMLDKLEPLAPRERVILEMELVPFQKYPKPCLPATIPTLSVLPSLRFLSIPRPLHTSLHLLGPEHFQISDTASSELDLALCAFLSSGVM